jgi:hypothetical protein
VNKVIDYLDLDGGWEAESGSTITVFGVNQYRDYVSGNHCSSLIFSFPEGNTGKTIFIEYDVAIDITGYEEIVFHAWSRDKNGLSFLKTADFNYAIKFESSGGSSVEYLLPTVEGFNSVTFKIPSGLTDIETITLTALHDDDDYLILSNMLAVKEELPLDIYNAVKEHLDIAVLTDYPYGGKLIGTAAGLEEDDALIAISSYAYLDRFAVILIQDATDSTISEIHQIIEFDEGSGVTFSSKYSGKLIKNDYEHANVYLMFPVVSGEAGQEPNIPGIMIYGMTPDHVWRGAALEDINDSFQASGESEVRREGAIDKYLLNIVVSSRHDSLLVYMAELVHTLIHKHHLWINGQYHEVDHEGIPTESDPTQVYEMVPQITFVMSVEIKGEIYSRESLVKAKAATTLIDFQ